MYYERNGPLARCVRRNVANEWERTMEVCVRYEVRDGVRDADGLKHV